MRRVTRSAAQAVIGTAVVAIVVLLPVEVVRGAAVLVSRDSQLNGSYLFGAGSATTVGGDDDSESSLDQRRSLSIADQNQDTGTANGERWSASASVSASHSFVLDGRADALDGITSSGSSTATTLTDGPAVAGADVRNPGNRLALVFSVDVPTAYRLDVTTADSDTQANLGSVQLQRGDGVRWATFVGSADETALYTGELRPGLHRIVADARAEAGGASGSGFGSWSYNLSLTPVPLPGAALCFAPALVLLAWRGRQARSFGCRAEGRSAPAGPRSGTGLQGASKKGRAA